MVQHLMQDLDSEFKGKRGPKAYPRVLLLIVVLYCFSEDINKYKSMILEGKTPTRGTFANFLKSMLDNALTN